MPRRVVVWAILVGLSWFGATGCGEDNVRFENFDRNGNERISLREWEVRIADWDIDDDQALDQEEFRFTADFERADINDDTLADSAELEILFMRSDTSLDGVLSRGEFAALTDE